MKVPNANWSPPLSDSFDLDSYSSAGSLFINFERDSDLEAELDTTYATIT